MPDRPRPDRPHPDRARRADRDRRDRQPGWEQYGAFGPDTDTELPPWAGPAIYPARPGGTRLRPPPDDYQRGEHPDPWAGDEPPAWPEEAPRPAEAPGAPPGRRRGGRRAAAARLRKSRRRVLRWCG